MADHNGWRKHKATRRTGHSQYPKGLKPIIVGHLVREQLVVRESNREIREAQR